MVTFKLRLEGGERESRAESWERISYPFKGKDLGQEHVWCLRNCKEVLVAGVQ